MKKCNTCGADIDDNAIICNVCGAPQLAMDTKETSSKLENQAQNDMGMGMNQYQNQVNPFMTGNQMPGAMNPGAVDSFGNPISSGYSRPAQTYSYTPAPRKSGSAMKTIITIFVAAVVLVFALVAFKKFSGPSIKSSVEGYYQAMGNLDGKAFFNAAYPPEVIEKLDEMLAGLNADNIYDFGIKYVMKYLGKTPVRTTYKDIKISDNVYAKKSELEQVEEIVNSQFGTNIKVSSARAFTVTYKYSTDGTTWLDGKDQGIAYKVDGKWYVICGNYR